MKFAVRPLALGLLLLAFGAGPAAAQYMKLTSDNPTNNTQMNAAGSTLITIALNSNHDKDGSLQTCGSHAAALCGGSTTAENLDVFSYTIILTAVGGTVTWGTFTPADPSYGSGGAPTPTSTQVEINFSRASGVTPQGQFTVGSLSVTPTSGNPSIVIAHGQQPIDPSGFGTLFGTSCQAGILTGSYLLGDPADPCGAGIGDWFDADGLAAAAGGNANPSLVAPVTASGTEGVAIATITATATDPDAAQTLTITETRKPADLTFTPTPSVSPSTATITGTPGFTDAGTYNIQWSVSDGNGGTANATTLLTIANANQAPVLAQPGNMTVNEGATADQTLNATDADGQPLDFSLAAGAPTFAMVTTTSPGTGTATGNLHLAPGFSSAGTYSITVNVTDGTATNSKSLTVTVVNVNRVPTLNAVSNMTVQEGTTQDQTITGSDADGDALTFTKASGPSFMTVSTTNATTGSIHLAPSVGDAGTYSASATASDGTATSSPQSFTITVTPAAQQNNAPVLANVTNMTVNEGATDNQVITATDADGDALTFTGSGPGFMTVTTTSPGTGSATGNIALAPGFSDAGTYSASISVSDGKGGTDSQPFTITVVNVNRAPTLNAISDMTVQEGTTQDQTITGSDPDGDALMFTKATGPSFMTVSTTNATTGSIHLAPSVGDAGTYSASATASDGTATSTPQSFTITVTPAGQPNNPPVVTAPATQTVQENQLLTFTVNATDQDGDHVTLTAGNLPTGANFLDNGNNTGTFTWVPTFSQAGSYPVTFTGTDVHGATGTALTVITVENVNQGPTADPDGPYTGVINVPITFNGTGSSDPDGDALTYEWDFDATDGITPGGDATGPNPTHTYTSPATYTVTLTVSDGTLSATATTTATVSNELLADAFVAGGDKTIRLASGKPLWCVQIQPVSGSFNVTDVSLSSIQASYAGVTIDAISGKTTLDGDRNGDGISELKACFSKGDLRTLFASLPNGRQSVNVTISGDLTSGAPFTASVSVDVVKAGGGALARFNANASPNPFNPATTISFQTSKPGNVSLQVFDVSGRLVNTLANQYMGTGYHEVRWGGTSVTGSKVSSGVYFYVLKTAEGTVKDQLVVTK